MSPELNQATLTLVKVGAVTLTPAAIAADGTATSTATATTTPAGRALTWSIVGDAKGCTIVASTGVVTAGTTGGTITVRGTDAPSGAYNQATLTLVKVGAVTLTPASIPANGTATSTASATTTPAGRTLTWSIVGDAKGCTIVAGTGVVTAGTTAGSITVRGTDAPTGAKSDGTLTLTAP